MPERPWVAFRQKSATLLPKAQMTPNPVMATRGIVKRLVFLDLPALQVRRELLHDAADGGYGARFAVGNVDVELIFQFEEDVNPIERVDAEFFEGGIGTDCFGTHLFYRCDNADDFG